MRHGETIAMLLEDCAGGRRVSHISEARRKRCFGTTCVPFGVHFCCFVFRISVLCPMGTTVFILRALGVPWTSPGLHFWSSGDALVFIFPVLGVSCAAFWKPWGPLGSILAKLVASGSPFFHFWVSPGLHFGGLGGSLGSFSAKLVASGAPWGFQCPPSRPKPNFLKFPPPFLEAFWTFFGGKDRLKNR